MTVPHLFGGYSYENYEFVPTGLTSLKLTNCTFIKQGALKGVAITSITLSNNIKFIEKEVFQGSNITDVYFNGTLKEWCNIDFQALNANPMYGGNATFYLAKNKYEYYGYKEITTVEVPEAVEKLSYTFVNFKQLTSVIVPDTVKSISDSTFAGCTALKSITLPFVGGSEDENTWFGYIFGQTGIWVEKYDFVPTSLKNVIITGGKNIGDRSFKDCSNIEVITIPTTITSIGESVFEGCTGLTSMIIPSSVTSIGFGIFKGCSNIHTISIPFIGPKVDSTDKAYLGYLYQGYSAWNHAETIEENLKNVIITDDFDILTMAFYNCTYIESLVLPNTISSIEANAFTGCTNLKSIYYNGEEDWSNITIDSSNDSILNNAIIYFYSPSTPNQDGNFWYYDESNNITIWSSKEEDNK